MMDSALIRRQTWQEILPFVPGSGAVASSGTRYISFLRASISSISMDFAEWSSTLSTARTLVKAGVLGSTMTFSGNPRVQQWVESIPTHLRALTATD